LVTTGGGGAELYPVFRRDSASAQYLAINHFVRVKIRGATMSFRVLDASGQVADEFVVNRSAPVSGRMAATWHTPSPPPGGSANGDGNVSGEVYDLRGMALDSVAGHSANLGRFQANEDWGATYFGLRDVMLWPGQTLMLFLARTGVPGVGTVRGSSSRGANEALREFIRRARKQGSNLVFTPDGPKGPARVAKPGVVFAAQMTGLPILPMAFAAKKKSCSHRGTGWSSRGRSRNRCTSTASRSSCRVTATSRSGA
jgi:hypothetical protein